MLRSRSLLPSLRSIAIYAVCLSCALAAAACTPDYTYEPGPLPDTFEEYYQARLQASKEAGVRPGNEERLIRYGARTELVILYIHGFGASRAEGEAVIEPIARRYQANTYFTRLPGHGANKEDHAGTTFPDYVVLAEEAFAMSKKLGNRVILVGTSTGGLLATYLAARHPDEVAGVILSSPFYEFVNPTAFLFAVPGGLSLVHALYGEDRYAGWGEDPEGLKVDGYDDYWLTTQKYSAIVPLDKLRRYIAREEFYSKVTSPVLLLHYYKDEEHQDETASVPAMREAFDQFGSAGTPSPLNRWAPVANSNHIMMSKYVRSDKVTVVREITDFIDRILESGKQSRPAEKAS